jgi:hypothetical protein
MSKSNLNSIHASIDPTWTLIYRNLALNFDPFLTSFNHLHFIHHQRWILYILLVYSLHFKYFHLISYLIKCEGIAGSSSIASVYCVFHFFTNKFLLCLLNDICLPLISSANNKMFISDKWTIPVIRRYRRAEKIFNVCLCGLVVRVPGYRSGDPGFDFRHYKKK